MPGLRLFGTGNLLYIMATSFVASDVAFSRYFNAYPRYGRSLRNWTSDWPGMWCNSCYMLPVLMATRAQTRAPTAGRRIAKPRISLDRRV